MAGDDQEDFACPGNRYAPAHTDHLPGRFRRSQPSVSGGGLPRTIRRGADFLLQLDHETVPARSPDQRRHGSVHCGGSVPPGVVRRDLHGGGDGFHGAGWTEPGQGCDGAGRRRRRIRGGTHPHGQESRGALLRRERRRVYHRNSGVPRPPPRTGVRRAA